MTVGSCVLLSLLMVPPLGECWNLLDVKVFCVVVLCCVVCVGFLVRTSSLADTAEPGVLADEPGDVAGPTAEPGESPSPATSWIS